MSQPASRRLPRPGQRALDCARAGLVAAALGWLAGCALDVSFDGTAYQCAQSHRCPAGMECVEGICQAPGPDASSCAPPIAGPAVTARAGVPPDGVTEAALSAAVTGQSRLLLVAVSYRATGGQKVTGVDLGSAPLTRLCHAGVGSEYLTDLWYRQDPPEGSLTVTARFDGDVDSVVLAAIPFSNVGPEPLGDSMCPMDAAGTGQTQATAIQATMTAPSCDAIFGAVTTYVDDPQGDGVNDLVPADGVIEKYQEARPAGTLWNTVAAGGLRPGGGDVTIGWTAEIRWAWSMAAVVVQGR